MKIHLPLLEALARLSEVTGDEKFDKMMAKVTDPKNFPKKTAPSTEKKIKALLRASEQKLQREARFKEFDVSMPEKTVNWVTQETTSKESQVTADQLARIFSENDLRGWTIKVVSRNEYQGENTPWKSAKSK